MDVQIIHNSVDITRKVSEYNRSQNICDGTGLLDLKCVSTVNFNAWDEIIINEGGIKKGTFVIFNIGTNAGGDMVIQAQDYSKKLVDYFVDNPYEQDLPEGTITHCKEWIERFATDATVDYVFNVSGSGAAIGSGTALGMAPAYDIIVNLLQQSGWYMYFDEDGICHFGNLKKSASSYAARLTDDIILSIEQMKNDQMLRNRAVVWGNGVFVDKTTRTPWNYDRRDVRTTVLASSHVHLNSTARSLANKILNEYARLTNVFTVKIAGVLDVHVGDNVFLDSNFHSSIKMITSIQVAMSASGLITTLVLAERCPRLFGFIDEDGIPGGDAYVYIGTWGSGVWRKPLHADGWEAWSVGLPNLYIVDLYIENGLFVCVANDGYAYWRNLYTTEWTRITIGVQEDVDNHHYSDLRAVACTIDADSNYIYVGYNHSYGNSDMRSWVAEIDGAGRVLHTYQVILEGEQLFGIEDLDRNTKENVVSTLGPITIIFGHTKREVQPFYHVDYGSVFIGPTTASVSGSVVSGVGNINFNDIVDSYDPNGIWTYQTNHIKDGEKWYAVAAGFYVGLQYRNMMLIEWDFSTTPYRRTIIAASGAVVSGVAFSGASSIEAFAWGNWNYLYKTPGAMEFDILTVFKTPDLIAPNYNYAFSHYNVAFSGVALSGNPVTSGVASYAISTWGQDYDVDMQFPTPFFRDGRMVGAIIGRKRELSPASYGIVTDVTSDVTHYLVDTYSYDVVTPLYTRSNMTDMLSMDHIGLGGWKRSVKAVDQSEIIPMATTAGFAVLREGKTKYYAGYDPTTNSITKNLGNSDPDGDTFWGENGRGVTEVAVDCYVLNMSTGELVTTSGYVEPTVENNQDLIFDPIWLQNPTYSPPRKDWPEKYKSLTGITISKKGVQDCRGAENYDSDGVGASSYYLTGQNYIQLESTSESSDCALVKVNTQMYADWVNIGCANWEKYIHQLTGVIQFPEAIGVMGVLNSQSYLTMQSRWDEALHRCVCTKGGPGRVIGDPNVYFSSGASEVWGETFTNAGENFHEENVIQKTSIHPTISKYTESEGGVFIAPMNTPVAAFSEGGGIVDGWFNYVTIDPTYTGPNYPINWSLFDSRTLQYVADHEIGDLPVISGLPGGNTQLVFSKHVDDYDDSIYVTKTSDRVVVGINAQDGTTTKTITNIPDWTQELMFMDGFLLQRGTYGVKGRWSDGYNTGVFRKLKDSVFSGIYATIILRNEDELYEYVDYELAFTKVEISKEYPTVTFTRRDVPLPYIPAFQGVIDKNHSKIYDETYSGYVYLNRAGIDERIFDLDTDDISIPPVSTETGIFNRYVGITWQDTIPIIPIDKSTGWQNLQTFSGATSFFETSNIIYPPYFFVSFSGSYHSFFQRNPDSSGIWTEYISSYPVAETTVIRVDDRL